MAHIPSRIKKKIKKKSPILKNKYNSLKKKFTALNCPQKKGYCVKIDIFKPKKPNSAARKVARVELSGGKKIIAYLPGEKNPTQEHSYVLVRGGRVADLPGVKYHVVPGALDSKGIENRKQGRSLYGKKKDK
jgi:small subunit ribosomal protein S12